MKCVNCGADVSGSKCEYCGTTYERTGSGRNTIKATFSGDSLYGQLLFGKETLKVYIKDMEIRTCEPYNFGRKLDGKIAVDKPIRKRKFTLIEI